MDCVEALLSPGTTSVVRYGHVQLSLEELSLLLLDMGLSARDCSVGKSGPGHGNIFRVEYVRERFVLGRTDDRRGEASSAEEKDRCMIRSMFE